MIDSDRIPNPWQYHTYVNGENYYNDQDDLVNIAVSENGDLRVFNTSGHPDSPQATKLREEYDSEEDAEEAAIEWMERNSPPAPEN